MTHFFAFLLALFGVNGSSGADAKSDPRGTTQVTQCRPIDAAGDGQIDYYICRQKPE